MPKGVKGIWTDEITAAAKKEFLGGASAASVARFIFLKFGVRTTRNAVIGKMNRIGASRARENRKPGLRAVAGVSVSRQARKRRRAENSKRDTLQPRKPTKPLPKIETSVVPKDPAPFLELRPDQCAWSIQGRGADMLCCGHPVDATQNMKFCKAHVRQAIANPAPDRTPEQQAKIDQRMAAMRSAKRARAA